MKICFPVKEPNGLESEVFGHFGSAPHFVVYDTDEKKLDTIGNSDRHHAHGQCSPLKALDGKEVDCVVVGGIGGGALTKLDRAGVKVFKAAGLMVKDNIELFMSGGLSRFNPSLVCRGHGGGGGCSHH